MCPVQQLDVTDLPDGCVLEPGEVLKRQEIFLAIEEHPESMLGDVRNFRLQNAAATL